MLITSLLRIWLTRSFQPFVFKNTSGNYLDYADEPEMGLYVHIPFCRSLCSFCPYCKVVYHRETAEKYKLALLKEIEIAGSRLKTKKKVTSLYIGGGTPALMLDDLKDIIDCLKKYFVIQQGIGMELHPDDINPEALVQIKRAGVTMVSIGIQSFHQESLSALGRKNSDFAARLRLVQKADFDVVDVDLIFALPGQTEDILLQDIEEAFSNGATQISTYPFIDFTFNDNDYKPMPEKGKKKLLTSIVNYCRRTGRERTSVWTFAQKNTGKYSSITRDSYLGFGVSAATLLRREFKINTFSLDDYIRKVEQDRVPTALTIDFTLRQRAAYYLFWNAYAMEIHPQKFQELIGKPLNQMYGLELWVGLKTGLIAKKNNVYYLTAKGAYYYHYIEQVYTTAYIDKMWNISRNTAFPDEIILK